MPCIGITPLNISTAPNDHTLKALAGKPAFARGKACFDNGQVQQCRATAHGAEGIVRGGADYRVVLAAQHGPWQSACTCPVGQQGEFCKHAVALALAWRAGHLPNPPAPPVDALREWLHAQPQATLANWLHELAAADKDIAKSLKLRQSADDPAALKKALASLLRAPGFLDYHGSTRYAQKLDEPLRLLADVLGRNPAQALALLHDALLRLLKIIENADDSNGEISSQIAGFVALHQQALALAQATLTPAQKAVELLALEQADGYGFFHLADYWAALGSEAQALYGAKAIAAFEALPVSVPRRMGAMDTASFQYSRTRNRAEDFARLSGDVALRLRILQTDLGGVWGYEKLVVACLEAGREREAQQWAEQAAKVFPKEARARKLLISAHLRSGFVEDALPLLWKNFCEAPNPTEWRALKAAAGADWPAWWAKALAEVQAREAAHKGERPNASVRVTLLLREDELDTAHEAAQVSGLSPDVLQDLADTLWRAGREQTAAPYYRRLVAAQLQGLPDAARYPQAVAWIARTMSLPDAAAWLAALRTQYAPRRKLLVLLDQAALKPAPP